MDRKGSAGDILYLGLGMLVLAFVVLIGFKVVGELDDHFQASDIVNAQGQAASTQLVGFYPGVIDNSVLFFAVGLAIVAFVLAAMVRVHPIFIPIFIIALIFIVFISGILSNVYQGMASSADFIAYANQLTFTTTILTYLPMFIAVFGTILMVVMYKSWQGAQM